jgi:hypothetical protein
VTSVLSSSLVKVDTEALLAREEILARRQEVWE